MLLKTKMLYTTIIDDYKLVSSLSLVSVHDNKSHCHDLLLGRHDNPERGGSFDESALHTV